MEKYWQPLYFYARRQGLSSQDAEDATQSFMMRLVESDFLETADPAKGRFRSYLLTHWKRFLIDRARAEGRIKRGGHASVVSLSYAPAEEDWVRWSASSPQGGARGGCDPDQAFEEEWARSILRNTVEHLRAEYTSSHRGATFDLLIPYLTRPVVAETYMLLSKQLSVSVGAAKVALHRLRHRFAQELRANVQATIEDPSDLEAEIRILQAYLHST
jgi:RNA polymerase sigma-70 factor (ECF subfamily)